jgi:hypothetical protein
MSVMNFTTAIKYFDDELQSRLTFVECDLSTAVYRKLQTRFEIDMIEEDAMRSAPECRAIFAQVAKETVDKIVEELSGCNVVRVTSRIVIDPNTFCPIVMFSSILSP